MSAVVQRPSESDVTWLHGRTSDLLLGAGIAYLVSVPLIIFAAQTMGVTTWPYFVVWFIGLAITVPTRSSMQPAKNSY